MLSEKKLSLSELSNELSSWRESGRLGRKVPYALRIRAIELLSKHSVSEIITKLGINSKMLNDWQHKSNSNLPAPFFVSLPTTSIKEEKLVSENLLLKLSKQSSNGAIWSVEGNLSVAGWENVLTLLEGVKS